MKKVIHESEIFELTKKNVRNPKKRGKGHPHYIIEDKSIYELDNVR